MFFRNKKTEKIYQKDCEGVFTYRDVKCEKQLVSSAFVLEDEDKIKKKKFKIWLANFLEKLSWIKKSLKVVRIFVVDHLFLVFKSPAHNHLRILDCKKSHKFNDACSLEFRSFTELKRYQKKVRIFTFSFSSTVASVLVAIIVIQFFFPGFNSQGATYTFKQTSWSGGSDVSTASHLNDQTGWNKFQNKDANLSVVNGGADLQLTSIAGTKTETSDVDFVAGIKNNTTVNGVGVGGNVQIGKNIVAIDGGSTHTLILKSDGTVWAWGANAQGQLGDNSVVNKSIPVQVKDAAGTGFLTGIVSIAAGNSFSVALKSDGTVWAWGENIYRQLGDNTTTQRNKPVQVTRVNTGDACLSGTGGTCTTVGIVSSIAAGNGHALALKSDGTIWAWGINTNGQLGDGTTTQRATPVQITNVNSGDACAAGSGGTCTTVGVVVSIYSGSAYSMALKSDGTIWAWGNNTSYQLGDGTTTQRTIPVQVTRVNTGDACLSGSGGTCTTVGFVSSISNNSGSTVVLKSDGTIWAWGNNTSYQLGDGTTTQRTIPVQVTRVNTGDACLSGPGGICTTIGVVSSIASGGIYSLALKSDGTVWSWGDNVYGQIGDSTTTGRSVPVQVTKVNAGDACVAGSGGTCTTIGLVVSISAGGYHSLTVTSDGGAWSWGLNTSGQLGDNTLISKSTAVQVKAWNFPTANYFSIGTVYKTAGDFISQILNTGQRRNFSTLTFASSIVANTNITLDARFGNTPAPDASWTAWQTNLASGADILAQSGNQYLQYRLNFISDGMSTPQFDDVTINFSSYPSSQALTSSPYNTNDAFNLLTKVAWTEILPTNTNVKFQMRSAPDNAGSPNWTSGSGWCGPATCANTTNDNDFATTFYESSPTGETANPVHIAGNNDQWIQYRTILESDGINTPILSDATLTYAVNATPQIKNITAIQNADGTVTSTFEVRDSDTTTGIGNGTVLGGLQYCTANCSNIGNETWTNATTVTYGNSSNNALPNNILDVQESSYTQYSATWAPKIDYDSHYNSNIKIRITANDSEMANNIGYGISNTFVLDTINPAKNLANQTIFTINKSQNKLTINAPVEQTNYEVYISNSSADLFDISKKTSPLVNQATIFPKEYSYLNMPIDGQPIYVGFKDEKGNVATFSQIAPSTPQNQTFYDLTDIPAGEYREFLSWTRVMQMGSGGFKKYSLFRSAGNNTSYDLNSPILTITNSLLNYHLDGGLTAGVHYYYKLLAEDNYGNISAFSNEVDDVPDAQGASDQTAPAISNVVISAITTTGAKISWDTDEISDSTVGYSEDFSYLSERSVPTMIKTNHEVFLTDLKADTTYNIKVKSRDNVGNAGESTGFSFKTNPGPAISNVSTIEVSNNDAKIFWETNLDANSYVIFSDTVFGGALVNPIEMGNPNLIGGSFPFQHMQTISGLSAGKTYYYSIKSTDANNNIATSNNAGNFYQFTTTVDTTPPTVTENSGNPLILTDMEAVLGFSTAKKAQVRLGYKEPADVGYTFLPWTAAYNLEHIITLSNLTKETLYYYYLEARDNNGNSAVSSLNSFTTKQKQTDHPELINVGNPFLVQISDVESFVALGPTNATSTAKLCYDIVPVADMDTCANHVDIIIPTKTHVFHLTNLLPNTQYFVKTKITDSVYPAINFTSIDVSFTTMESLVTHPELINPGQPTITQASDSEMVISLPTSNTTATSKLCWSESNLIDIDTCANKIEITAPTRTHVFHIINLSPNTSYYFKTKITDAVNANVSFVSNEISSATTQTQVAHPPLTDPGINAQEILLLNDTQAVARVVANTHSTAKLCYSKSAISNVDFATCQNNDPADDLHYLESTLQSFEHVFNLGSDAASSDNEPLLQKTKYYYRTEVSDSRDSANKFLLDQKDFTTKKTQIDVQDGLTQINVPTADQIVEGVGGVAFISWKTDQNANSEIGCSTTNGLYETLTSNNLTDFTKNHTLMITGLIQSQKYYCQITSTDSLIPANTRSVTFSFNSSDPPTALPVTKITFAKDNPSLLTDTDVVISFSTDQAAQCILSYYEDALPEIPTVPFAEDFYNITHNIHLSKLKYSTKYSYTVSCHDAIKYASVDVDGKEILDYKNITSDKQEFITKEKNYTASGIGDLLDRVPPTISNVKIANTTGESAIITWETDEKGSSSVRYGSLDISESIAGDGKINNNSNNYSLAHTVTVNGLVPASKYIFSVLSADAAGNIGESSQSSFTTASPSSLSSINVVSKDLGQAVVTWKTSTETTSTVEYGLSTTYGEKKEDSSFTKEHSINLASLNQGVTYHYRVKGKDKNGKLYSSSDNTFEPKSPAKITNISVNDISEHGGVISFKTNVPTDANVIYTDVRDRQVTGSQGTRELSIDHKITLDNLAQGTTFALTISVKDEQGTQSNIDAADFTTGQDNVAPKIDNVKTDSALTQSDKVQTIISWKTDEQASTSILYREGRGGEEKEIKVTNNLTTNHVGVITVFKAGTVYNFKVKSVDSSGNEAISSDYALLTPRKRENIIQIIIGNFSDIFGWAGNFGK